MQGAARGHRAGAFGEPRPPGFEPRRGGNHGGAALRVQHARRPHRMGCGASGLRPQDTDGKAGAVQDEPQAARHHALPLAEGKRVRHVHLRTCLKQHLGGLGNGSSEPAVNGQGLTAKKGGGRDWRRRDERRAGIRRTQQRIVVAQRPAHHPQRQQHVDRPFGGRHEGIPHQPEHQRDLQPAALQSLQMAQPQGVSGRRPPQRTHPTEQRP